MVRKINDKGVWKEAVVACEGTEKNYKNLRTTMPDPTLE